MLPKTAPTSGGSPSVARVLFVNLPRNRVLNTSTGGLRQVAQAKPVCLARFFLSALLGLHRGGSKSRAGAAVLIPSR